MDVAEEAKIASAIAIARTLANNVVQKLRMQRCAEYISPHFVFGDNSATGFGEKKLTGIAGDRWADGGIRSTKCPRITNAQVVCAHIVHKV